MCQSHTQWRHCRLPLSFLSLCVSPPPQLFFFFFSCLANWDNISSPLERKWEHRFASHHQKGSALNQRLLLGKVLPPCRDSSSDSIKKERGALTVDVCRGVLSFDSHFQQENSPRFISPIFPSFFFTRVSVFNIYFLLSLACNRTRIARRSLYRYTFFFLYKYI